MNEHEIVRRLREAKIPHARIAQAIGRAQPAATRLLGGQRNLKANEIPALIKVLDDWRQEQSSLMQIPKESPEDTIDYVPVETLPTYAGMGGGGTGEGEIEHALVPRYLIEGVLRGTPSDFVLIRTRGDSMFPDFHHDDELLCDKRDTSPAQPGPFALWHDDEYLVKNVEKLANGQVRIFSSNPKYETVEIAREETRIIGRPVWCGRRL